MKPNPKYLILPAGQFLTGIASGKVVAPDIAASIFTHSLIKPLDYIDSTFPGRVNQHLLQVVMLMYETLTQYLL
jgi:hypothetical protein